jgi:hypothetical protein
VGRKAQNAVTAAALLIAAASLAFPLASAQLPQEPAHETGASVTGSFEGWFRNPDGTYTLLLGYYNRNRKEEVDIPIGPQNQIEPGGPDRGQPTHFITGRDWGVFTIKVPADFGQKKLTWTLSVNGQVTSIPASLKTEWELSPFVEAAVGNTPPILSFEEKGPSTQGPIAVTAERSAKVGVALSLTAFVSDDAKFTSNSGARPKNLAGPVTIRWSMFRGVEPIKFSSERPMVEKLDRPGIAFAGKATTTATFSKPGEYILRVVANDYSGDGGGGFQCCWTNGQVKVSVGE